MMLFGFAINMQIVFAGIVGGFLGGIGFFASEKFCKWVYHKLKKHALEKIPLKV